LLGSFPPSLGRLSLPSLLARREPTLLWDQQRQRRMRIGHGGYVSVLARNKERSFVAALLRMTAKGGKRKARSERLTAKGKQEAEGGRRKAEGGRRKAEGGGLKARGTRNAALLRITDEMQMRTGARGPRWQSWDGSGEEEISLDRPFRNDKLWRIGWRGHVIRGAFPGGDANWATSERGESQCKPSNIIWMRCGREGIGRGRLIAR
jgi:hypothetical protein